MFTHRFWRSAFVAALLALFANSTSTIAISEEPIPLFEPLAVNPQPRVLPGSWWDLLFSFGKALQEGLARLLGQIVPSIYLSFGLTLDLLAEIAPRVPAKEIHDAKAEFNEEGINSDHALAHLRNLHAQAAADHADITLMPRFVIVRGTLPVGEDVRDESELLNWCPRWVVFSDDVDLDVVFARFDADRSHSLPSNLQSAPQEPATLFELQFVATKLPAEIASIEPSADYLKALYRSGLITADVTIVYVTKPKLLADGTLANDVLAVSPTITINGRFRFDGTAWQVVDPAEE